MEWHNFVACIETHPENGKGCELERGHTKLGMPHMATLYRGIRPIGPAYWDENGVRTEPEFVSCPEACGTAILVHPMAPDLALMNMVRHFVNDHADMCPLELMDRTVA